MEQDPQQLPQPETLYAAALYLATNYAKSGCPMLCRMVMRQLACILNYPGESVSPALREVCRSLYVEWERIAASRALELHEGLRPGAAAQAIH